MYADWWYVWCLTYFMGTYKDVLIVLKKSLKWVPIVGWVCSPLHTTYVNLLTCCVGHAVLQVHLLEPLLGLGPVAFG